MDYREAVNRARQWYNTCADLNPAYLEPEDILALEYLQAKQATPTIIGQLLENGTVITRITDIKLTVDNNDNNDNNGCNGCCYEQNRLALIGNPCSVCSNYEYYEKD